MHQIIISYHKSVEANIISSSITKEPNVTCFSFCL